MPMRLPGGCGDVHWHNHFGEVGRWGAGGGSAGKGPGDQMSVG